MILAEYLAFAMNKTMNSNHLVQKISKRMRKLQQNVIPSKAGIINIENKLFIFRIKEDLEAEKFLIYRIARGCRASSADIQVLKHVKIKSKVGKIAALLFNHTKEKVSETVNYIHILVHTCDYVDLKQVISDPEVLEYYEESVKRVDKCPACLLAGLTVNNAKGMRAGFGLRYEK